MAGGQVGARGGVARIAEAVAVRVAIVSVGRGGVIDAEVVEQRGAGAGFQTQPGQRGLVGRIHAGDGRGSQGLAVQPSGQLHGGSRADIMDLAGLPRSGRVGADRRAIPAQHLARLVEGQQRAGIGGPRVALAEMDPAAQRVAAVGERFRSVPHPALHPKIGGQGDRTVSQGRPGAADDALHPEHLVAAAGRIGEHPVVRGIRGVGVGEPMGRRPETGRIALEILPQQRVRPGFLVHREDADTAGTPDRDRSGAGHAAVGRHGVGHHAGSPAEIPA